MDLTLIRGLLCLSHFRNKCSSNKVFKNHVFAVEAMQVSFNREPAAKAVLIFHHRISKPEKGGDKK